MFLMYPVPFLSISPLNYHTTYQKKDFVVPWQGIRSPERGRTAARSGCQEKQSEPIDFNADRKFTVAGQEGYSFAENNEYTRPDEKTCQENFLNAISPDGWVVFTREKRLLSLTGF